MKVKQKKIEWKKKVLQEWTEESESESKPISKDWGTERERKENYIEMNER